MSDQFSILQAKIEEDLKLLEILNKFQESIKQEKETQKHLDDFCGVWITGPERCGKTKTAIKLYQNAYFKYPHDKWWDNYNNQQFIIIDDFNLENRNIGHLLRLWSNKEPFVAEGRCWIKTIRPKIICVTSSYTIEQIWDGNPYMIKDLKNQFMTIKLS